MCDGNKASSAEDERGSDGAEDFDFDMDLDEINDVAEFSDRVAYDPAVREAYLSCMKAAGGVGEAVGLADEDAEKAFWGLTMTFIGRYEKFLYGRLIDGGSGFPPLALTMPARRTVLYLARDYPHMEPVLTAIINAFNAGEGRCEWGDVRDGQLHPDAEKVLMVRGIEADLELDD